MARPTLVTHRKFAKLIQKLRSASLKMPRACARGILEAIWDSAYASGDPAMGDSESLEGLVDWDGKPGFLTQALVDSGFIDRNPDHTYQIHDLYVHAPAYVQARMKREAEREAKGITLRDIRVNARKGKKKQTKSNEIHLSSNEPPPALALTPARAPALAQKENGSDKARRFADEPATPPPTALTLAFPGRSDHQLDPTVLVFPCKGETQTWKLTRSQINMWSELYPGLDIEGECRKALAWADANPAKKATAGGTKRFLVRWFSRANDNGGWRRGNGNNGPSRTVLAFTEGKS